MSNVIITNEELEQVVEYLEDYKREADSYSGTDTSILANLIKSLSVALDRNIELENN